MPIGHLRTGGNGLEAIQEEIATHEMSTLRLTHPRPNSVREVRIPVVNDVMHEAWRDVTRGAEEN